MGKRLLAVIATVLAGVLMFSSVAVASSHREAPLISEDPVADNTDVYMFRDPVDPNAVTMMADFVPVEEPAGGPNFYRFGDDVTYRMTVYNNRDRGADLRFDFKFKTTVRNPNTFLYNTGPITSLTDPDFNIRQTYTVTMVRGSKTTVLGRNIPTPPCNVGPKSTPDYEALAASAVTTLPCGISVFAGQRDDPFFVDTGGLFDLLTIRKPPGNAGGGVDGLSGFNCQTIAIRVPIRLVTANGKVPTNTADPNAVIGMYSSTLRSRVRVLRMNPSLTAHDGNSGSQIQVSRLGEPLINEVVIPLGHKDEWNRSNPVLDSQFLKYYQDPELGKLITGIYGINVPPAPRDDLVAILLKGFTVGDFTTVGGPNNTDLLRLNLAVPPVAPGDPGFSRLGVLGGDLSGFPNGRRLADDVTDIEIQAVAGATPFTPTFAVAPNNQLGDGVDANDAPFLGQFPYAATPWSGFSHPHEHQ